VGIIEDVTKAVPSGFQRAGEKVLLLESTREPIVWEMHDIGSSAFASNAFGQMWGAPPPLDISAEAALHKALVKLAEDGLISSAKDVTDGGIAVALAESCFPHGVGVKVNVSQFSTNHLAVSLFSEPASSVVVTCSNENYSKICALLDEAGEIFPLEIGITTHDGEMEVLADGEVLIRESIASLQNPWSNALESQLAAEVLV
ncbi:MAG: AIR synthase-related protein, partial [Granulicella sp.]